MHGVHYMKVRLGLPAAVIAAQAGWSERSVTSMVETSRTRSMSAGSPELDAAFQTQPQTQEAEIPHGEPS